METAEQPKSTKNKWAERLRGRSRMAVASIGGVFLIGFFLVSRPLSDRIDNASARLGKATDRMMLAAEVSDLRRQAAQYEKKLQRGVDLNDWTNYLLGGVRTERVRLIRMEPKKQLAIGPCKVLTWHVEMMGDFQSLARVVQWMENGERLVRIDKLTMQSKAQVVTMSLILRALVLDTPAEKGPATRPVKVRPTTSKVVGMKK